MKCVVLEWFWPIVRGEGQFWMGLICGLKSNYQAENTVLVIVGKAVVAVQLLSHVRLFVTA